MERGEGRGERGDNRSNDNGQGEEAETLKPRHQDLRSTVQEARGKMQDREMDNRLGGGV
jgi:hypothetical protein